MEDVTKGRESSKADKFRRVDSPEQRRRLRRVLFSVYSYRQNTFIRCSMFDVGRSMFDVHLFVCSMFIFFLNPFTEQKKGTNVERKTGYK